MSASKHFDSVAAIVTAMALAITVLFMNGPALGITASARTMGYESRLFDNTRVHTVDIVMDDWDELIANAVSEEYYAATVVIDGEAYKNIGIRTKGNTSLSTVASLGSERYSFKIEFDHYDKTKSYHGLDKLSLNNLIQDSTMMKDYLTYTMMNSFGAASSLCSYAYITVNGEDWGLYLAVEGVEEAFLERNYGSDYGELYKPDSMSFGGGRGNGKDFDPANFDPADFDPTDFDPSTFDASMPAGEGDFPGGSDLPPMPGGDMPNAPLTGGADISEGFDPAFDNFDSAARGGNGMNASDVKLQYVDDELSSYSNIWDNAKTDATNADKTRLIASLKKLSANEDIESVVDIDQTLRYFVVHNYVCNDDSYTGSMVHNYYLYEKDGRLSMLPWDYNLAFGTFRAGDATGTVNTPIDSPVSGDASDRPMLNWIFESEEYTELYHSYFSEFLAGVDIQGIIDSAYALIKDYVKKDPTAFYSSEEFELGTDTLRQFCRLRSENIALQLENSETVNDMGYADASAINLTDMGSMNGGMGGHDKTGNARHTRGQNDIHENSSPPEKPETAAQAPNIESVNGEITDPEHTADISISEMPAPENAPNGSIPDMPDPENAAEGLTPEMTDPESAAENSMGEMEIPKDSAHPSEGDVQRTGDAPAGVSGGPSTEPGAAQWLWLGISIFALGIGLIVAKKFRC